MKCVVKVLERTGRGPVKLARVPLRTMRPRDARGVYAAPGAQIARLEAGGALRRLARGYYAVVPDVAGDTWQPTIAQAALGIATSIFGPQGAALMAQSAARVHHVLPRAVATATVASVRQHRPIELSDGGQVVSVCRDVDGLDLRQEQLGDLGRGLVTTPEQTLVDLAGRHAARVQTDQRDEVLTGLLALADPEVVAELGGPTGRAAIAAIGAAS